MDDKLKSIGGATGVVDNAVQDGGAIHPLYRIILSLRPFIAHTIQIRTLRCRRQMDVDAVTRLATVVLPASIETMLEPGFS